MTGHRSALRAAVVAAIGAALLTASAIPAQAQPEDPPDLRLASIGGIELRVGGGQQSVQLRVENRGGDAGGVGITMTVPLVDLGVHITSTPGGCSAGGNASRMDCQVDIPAGQTWTGVAQVAVHGNSNLQSGESRSGNGEVIITNFNGGRQQFNVRLQGPDRPPGVGEVSGFVTDESTGERISGATVLLVDGQQVDHTETTNDNGEFRFAGDNIAAGSIGLRARKDGYEGRSTTHSVNAGGQLTGLQLTLRSTATPSPTPTPSATPSATPTGTAPPVAAAVEEPRSGLSFFTRLMIFLGVLFVLLGAGAIAYMIYRRRKEAAEEEGEDGEGFADDPTSGPTGPGPTPGSHGVYRPSPTQVSGAGAATALHPATAALADAPTMLHPRAGADDATTVLPRATDPAGPRSAEPPGPRPPAPGSPPPLRSAAPTYGGGQRTQPYGGSPAQSSGSGYGDPTMVGRPHQSGHQSGAAGIGGPGNGAAGHSAAGRGPAHAGPAYGSPAHGSPAGRPESGAGGYGPDPYTQPSAGRRPAGGYETGGYDAGSRDKGGYDAGSRDSGYEQPGHRGGGYDQPTQYGGQQDSAGYDSGGYQNGGYGRRDAGYEPADGRGGYNQPTGSHAATGYRGYDQSGYDQTSYDQPGYDRNGYGQASGYGQPGYEQTNYDQTGHDQSGQAGYGQPGYQTGAYDQATNYDRSGYDQSGYNRAGYNQSGYDQPGYDQPGYDQTAYDQSGYGSGGYDAPGYGGEQDGSGPPRRPGRSAERRRPDWSED